MLSVVTSGLATTRDVAAAFGLHEDTVQRLVRQGLGTVMPAKPGPKRKRKLTPAVLERIAKGSEHSLSSRQIQSWLQTDHGMVVSRSSPSWALQQMTRIELQQPRLKLDTAAAAAELEAVAVAPLSPLADVEPEPAQGDVPVVLPESRDVDMQPHAARLEWWTVTA
jgi:transposase